MQEVYKNQLNLEIIKKIVFYYRNHPEMHYDRYKSWNLKKWTLNFFELSKTY